MNRWTPAKRTRADMARDLQSWAVNATRAAVEAASTETLMQRHGVDRQTAEYWRVWRLGKSR